METIDIIRQLCADKGISVSQLENELGYGNGSLGKSKNMLGDRLYQISQYFGVSMEYLITGKTLTETDDEIALLRQQQSILMEINKINQTLNDYYKNIDICKDKLTALKDDYIKLEARKKPVEASNKDKKDESTPSEQMSVMDLFTMQSQFGKPQK